MGPMHKKQHQNYNNNQNKMDRRSLFSFDIMSNRGTRQIEIPLLKKHSFYKHTRNFYNNQINCIVDLCYTSKKYSPSPYEKVCMYIQKTISVVHPESQILLLWNILNLLAIFYNFIQIPIIIMVASVEQALVDDTAQQVFRIIDIICLFTFLFDLLLVRYRIAYYSNQVLITDVQIILTKYIQSGLIVDLVAFFVYFFDFLDESIGMYVKIIFYIKLYTFLKIDVLVQNKAMYNQYFNAFYRFIKMVGLIFFLTSLEACIYFSIDYNYFMDEGFNYQNGYLWLTASESVNYLNLMDAFNWPAWYIYALYWAVQTTSAVGYGNNTPRNPMQILLCNIIMLTTICIFVSFANTILDIVDELQESTLQRQAKYNEFNTFTTNYQTNRTTRQKIKNYLNALIESKQDDSEDFIYSLLPNQLQQRFSLNFKYYIFNNLPILDQLTKDKKKDWNSFALDLTHLLQSKYYSTGDYIQLAGKTSEFKLYMVQRGKVTAFNDIINYKKDYRDWEYFGQKEFFFEGITLSNIICRSFTKVYYFQRTQFVHLLRQYPELFQRCFEKMYEVRINNRLGQEFDLTCHNCDENHLLECCPIVTLWKNRLSRKQRRKQSQREERVSHDRRRIVSIKKIRHYKKDEVAVDKAYRFTTYLPYRNL